MPLIVTLFGFIIGGTLGLLGSGGSMLTVPIFVYALGIAPKDAVAMSLGVVGASSLAGAIGHIRRGNVDLRTALLFGGAASVGTWGGTKLATYVSGAMQLTILGAVMLTAGLVMFRKRRPAEAVSSARANVGLIVSGALVVGLLTGLVGVGGGFLIVPALVLLGVAMRVAVGTSLVVITWNCAVGFSSYLGHVQFEWMPMTLLALGSLPGIWVGTRLHDRVPQHHLRRVFATFLLLIGAFMVARNLPTVLALPHH